MTAHSAIAPTVTSRVIESNLYVSSELAEQLDPVELSSINELLDRIAALGVATNYDQVGPKPDLREINSPQATHHVAVVETQCGDPSSILRTSYVRIPEPSMPDIHGGEDTTQDLGLELGKPENIQDSGSRNPEVVRPPNSKPGEVSGLMNSARPILSDLSQIKQMPEETVHHYWARFLLLMNRIKDCHKGDAISIFCSNCTDKGILNAISRRNITRFTDLASIVQKYCAMESAWKTEIKFWDNPALNSNPVRIKRAHYSKTSRLNKKSKPSRGHGTVLERWLDGPCKIHSVEDATPTHSLRACWILRQVAKIGEDLLTPEVEGNQPGNFSTVLTISEIFAPNNRRKRTLRSLAEIYHVATINPWSNTAITFNASNEPKFRTARAPAALVLSPIVDGYRLTKVLMDGGSGLNLIYEETLQKMEIDWNRIERSNTTFRGIIPSQEARCTRKITLDVVFGTPDNYRSEQITFQVALFRSGYHAILGREAFTVFQAIPHYGYMKLKMPGPNRIITLTSDPDIALRAENKTAALALEALSEALAAEELTALQSTVSRDDVILDKRSKSTSFKPADEIVKFQVHTTDPNKTASIGARLNPDVDAALREFLSENWEIFAWHPSDMPGVPRRLAEHSLNIQKGFKPVKQTLQRFSEPKRQAMGEELAKLLEAGFIRDIKHPDWLANLVMVPKKDKSWRLCVDFKDLNKACSKDPFPLPRIDQIIDATARHDSLCFLDA